MSENDKITEETANDTLPAEVETDLAEQETDVMPAEPEEEEIAPEDVKIFGMPRHVFHWTALGAAGGYILAGVVGVIATTRTITSERYLRLVREFAGTKVKVVSVPCPGLMECVESGEWDSFRTQKLIEKYLHPIKRAGADKLVLGCTHYPFLSSALKRELGGGTELIDPSAAVARELKHQLLKRDLLSDCAKGREVFYISGDAEKHRAVIERLWSSEEALDLRSDPPAADPTLS